MDWIRNGHPCVAHGKAIARMDKDLLGGQRYPNMAKMQA